MRVLDVTTNIALVAVVTLETPPVTAPHARNQTLQANPTKISMPRIKSRELIGSGDFFN